MLETELDAKCILAGQRIRIPQTFGVGTAVAGNSEEILSLEIYSGILKKQLFLYLLRNGVAQSQCFQTEERTVLDVVLRTFILAVRVVNRRGGNIRGIVTGLEIIIICLGCRKKLGAVVAGPERKEIGVIF